MHRLLFLWIAATCTLAAGIDEDLLAAARAGDLNTVRTLVEKGAGLETKTAYGQTPLYLAAMNGHEEVAAFLLEKGASPDVSDTFYKAPMLVFALQRKHYGVVRRLIGKTGASPDQMLGQVAAAGDPTLLRAVLERGKPSQQALDKAYEMALDRKLAAAAAVLKEAGAREPSPAVQIDPKVLESYAGTWRTEGFPLDIKTSVREGRLYMQATGQGEFAPKPKSATVFEFAAAGIEVTFESASVFVLKQGGRDMRFRKLEAK